MHNRIPTPKHTANGKAARNAHYARNEPSTAVCDGAATTQSPPEPAAKPPAEPTSNTGRTAAGQFAAGNKLSKGNPFARRLGTLRSAFLNAITEADVTAVARKLADLAAAGDVQAAALFLTYAVGKPLPAVNPDRLDLDEFSIVDAAPSRSRAVAVILSAMDPAIVAELARSVIPNDVDKVITVLKKVTERDAQLVMGEEDARIGKPMRD